MKIHFTRDSVCMGDDCIENSRNYHFESNSNIKSIVSIIKENYFLVSVSGGDVVWVLIDPKNKEILPYSIKIDGGWFNEKFVGWKWYKHTIWGI
ncbi:MAG: hypothetical protein ACLR8H_00770 [Clostridium sp.]